MLVANIYSFVLDVCGCARVTNKSRICSSPEGLQQLLLCFAYRGRAGAQAAEPEHQGLVSVSTTWLLPAALSTTKWLCVFCVHCKWWLLHPKMHKWHLPMPRARCHPKQVGVNGSLEMVSAFQPSTGAFFMPLFPTRLKRAAIPLPVSLLDTGLFHLLRPPWGDKIKKCLSCVLGTV